MVDTLLPPREVLNRIYARLRLAYGLLANARPGDAEADKKILEHIDAMDQLMEILDAAFIRKVAQDATLEPKSHAHLEKLHEVMLELEKDKRASVRNQRNLLRRTRSMRRHLGIRSWKAKRAHQHEAHRLHKEVAKKESEARNIHKEISDRKEQLKKLKS